MTAVVKSPCWKCQGAGYGRDPNYDGRWLCLMHYGYAVDAQEHEAGQRAWADRRRLIRGPRWRRAL